MDRFVLHMTAAFCLLAACFESSFTLGGKVMAGGFAALNLYLAYRAHEDEE